MNIGFIGIGEMGKRMAQNVLIAGYDLTVNDLRKDVALDVLEKGAKWMDTPKAVAELCQVVLSSLPGPAEVEEVVYGAAGLMAGWKEGDIYVDMSTSSPTTIRRVAKDAKTIGVDVLDAPVSGGLLRAESGELVIMVGGSAQSLERVREVLKVIGDKVFHFGDVGCGNIVKLISNMISLTCNAINAEGFVLGAKAGIDVGKLHEALKVSAANNWSLEYEYPRVLQRDFYPRWRLALALKDINLALGLGKEYGVPLPVGAVVEQRFVEANAAGLGERASSSLILRLEELVGVQVRSTSAE